MQQTFQQVRGSAIGNQISPALANITVSYVEQQWPTQPNTQLLLHNDAPTASTPLDTLTAGWSFLTTNSNTTLPCNNSLQIHVTNHRYFLSQNLTLRFLVVLSILKTRHFSTFNQPTTWQFQPYTSAASKQHKLSAAYSRMYLAARHSFPKQQARQDVESVIQKYVSLGWLSGAATTNHGLARAPARKLFAVVSSPHFNLSICL